jgi:methyl-accepting chemotaxis protein
MTNWPQRRGAPGADRDANPSHDVNRRIRQVKEMVRLGAALRAEMGLERICAEVVESVSVSTGFRVAALNIVRSDSEYFDVVATIGLSEANQRELAQHPPRRQALIAVMRPEFCRSRSYFIPHQYYLQVLNAVGGVVEPPAPGLATKTPASPSDAWHPEDVLLAPLVSPRTGRLLGVLSLDQPEDGLVPSLETIEIIELFANQAALAIDTCRIFAEREQERQMIGQGLRRLRFHLDLARNRDLRLPVPPLNSALDPLAIALNEVLDAFNAVLADAQAASDLVNQHASEVRAAATYLSESAAEQAERILDLSTTVDSVAQQAQSIAATASQSSEVAHTASDLSHKGAEHTALAGEGMARVRELTLQTKKKVKRLGESAQEIGDIVQLVSAIAAQTNLLALNASIEAARAGEHGRGFAVVAQEIRRLATNATEATRQIHSRIQGVQNETHQVVVQIEHGVEQVVLQSELVTQAGAALAEVEQLNQRLAGDVQQINDTASEQAHAATQVAAIIKDLAYVSTQTSQSMEQARASMDYLVDLADALQRQISVFQVRKQQDVGITSPLAAAQSGALSGRLRATTGGLAPTMSPTMPPARSGALLGSAPDAPGAPGAPEPVTQPMPAVSAPRMPQPQGPGLRPLLQETAPAPTIPNLARGERSQPLPSDASGSLQNEAGEAGSGAPRLGDSWQPIHLTPLLMADTADAQSGSGDPSGEGGEGDEDGEGDEGDEGHTDEGGDGSGDETGERGEPGAQ